jgi:hypothetical protein
MKKRRRVPTDQEVHEAVLQRIDRMTREDWLKSIEELSHAPEGVEDPWPPYESDAANGAEPSCAEAVEVLRAVPGDLTQRSPG